MGQPITIKIGGGQAEAVYSDELKPVLDAMGDTTVRRASHVEPYEGGWMADMRPSGGPVLFLNGEAPAASFTVRFKTEGNTTVAAPIPAALVGLPLGKVKVIPANLDRSVLARVIASEDAVPFPTRQAALDAERAWLAEHRGL